MLSRITVLAYALTVVVVTGKTAFAAVDHPTAFSALAKQCAPSVSTVTLGKVVTHESSSNPYAIGLNSKVARLSRQPRTHSEAVATAEWLRDRGYRFDSGLGQVSSGNVSRLGLSFEDVFTPCKNLEFAGRILTDCYTRAVAKGYAQGQPALLAGLSCYNTGNFKDGFHNGYVGYVAAAPVTLTVPALETSDVSSKPPIKLQAVPEPPARPDPKPNHSGGLRDAFSRPVEDAFHSPKSSSEPPARVEKALISN